MARITTGHRIGSYDNMVIDGGAVSIGGVGIGQLKADSTLTINRELRFPEYDNAAGPRKGETRVIFVTASLSCQALEFSQGLLDKALLMSSGTPLDYLITSGAHYNVTLVGAKAGGGSVTVTLPDCIVEDGSVVAAPKDEGTISVTFECHGNPTIA